MSTEANKQRMDRNKSALAERLRQAATVSDGGLTPGNPRGSRAGPPQSDEEIIIELNEALQEIMAEPPLSVPSRHRHPLESPHLAIPDMSRSRAGGAVAMPTQTEAPSHLRDEENLQDWLARPPDDQPEPRSRSRVVALCAGTMVLSILAGYGSAQFVGVLLSSPDIVTNADETQSASASLDSGSQLLKALLSKQTPNPIEKGEESQSLLEQDGIDGEIESAAAIAPQKSVPPDVPLSAGDDDGDSLAESALEAPKPEPARPGDQTALLSQPNETTTFPTLAPEEKTISPTPPPNETRQRRIPSSGLTDKDQKRLYERAQRLLADHDISAARLIFLHLAETGSGRAALSLAESYDPEWLAEHGAGTIAPNEGMALRWYRMARERGETGTERRIEALSTVLKADN